MKLVPETCAILASLLFYTIFNEIDLKCKLSGKMIENTRSIQNTINKLMTIRYLFLVQGIIRFLINSVKKMGIGSCRSVFAWTGALLRLNKFFQK